MPIRNKDGSLYKIQGINPLMKDQDHWENDDWQVHYIKTDEIILPDPKRIIPEGYGEDQAVPAILGVGVVSPTEIVHCLPLIIHVTEDPLYGQKRKTTSWGEKFSFEAIKVDFTGLTITFFARLPQETVSRLEQGSILYVFKERQWWRINGVVQSSDGINIHCMPSDIKPSFV